MNSTTMYAVSTLLRTIERVQSAEFIENPSRVRSLAVLHPMPARQARSLRPIYRTSGCRCANTSSTAPPRRRCGSTRLTHTKDSIRRRPSKYNERSRDAKCLLPITLPTLRRAWLRRPAPRRDGAGPLVTRLNEPTLHGSTRRSTRRARRASRVTSRTTDAPRRRYISAARPATLRMRRPPRLGLFASSFFCTTTRIRWITAPATVRLPLLPSGSGGVHGVAPREAQPPSWLAHDSICQGPSPPAYRPERPPWAPKFRACTTSSSKRRDVANETVLPVLLKGSRHNAVLRPRRLRPA